jgi:hypothetical protein
MSTLFSTITADDWRAMFRDFRAAGGVEGNVVWRRIRAKLMSETHVLKLLAGAVEAALADAEDAIASAEESQLRVPSDHIRDRAKLYRRALNAYYTTFPADGSAHPESRRVEASQERGGDIISK